MRCPSCGADVDSAYCGYCGTKMPIERVETTTINAENVTVNNYYGAQPQQGARSQYVEQPQQQPQQAPFDTLRDAAYNAAYSAVNNAVNTAFPPPHPYRAHPRNPGQSPCSCASSSGSSVRIGSTRDIT